MIVAEKKFLIQDSVELFESKKKKTTMVANLNTGKIYRMYKSKLGKVKKEEKITIQSLAVTEINRTFANLDKKGKALANTIKEVAEIKNTKLDRTFKY